MQSLLRPFITACCIALLPVLVFYLLQPSQDWALSWGVIPGDWKHLQGLILMPFVHANAEHLWGNTMQLFLGIFMLFVHFRHLSKYVVLLIWGITGVLLFFLGKMGSVHVGSSGVVYGLFGFLILAGFIAGSRRLRLLSFILLMYYGSMIWGIFPWQEKISWEGHLSGLLAGFITALLLSREYRKFTRDPKPFWFYDNESRIDPYGHFNKTD